MYEYCVPTSLAILTLTCFYFRFQIINADHECLTIVISLERKFSRLDVGSAVFKFFCHYHANDSTDILRGISIGCLYDTRRVSAALLLLLNA
ncbi:hypothetical protein C8R45DRAFT_1033209 [Mycena sanguinolenta]|nr:hypothetical protein C8R45DRAFT_1033172 [Mycena sanguinolenta]KAJ6457290.1 hypothetical protein C8R45DRAFT_1033209 [Mycena sanguinolenta]